MPIKEISMVNEAERNSKPGMNHHSFNTGLLGPRIHQAFVQTANQVLNKNNSEVQGLSTLLLSLCP